MVLKRLVKLIAFAALLLSAAFAVCAKAPGLTGAKQLGIDGGIHRARLISQDIACATQAESGLFAFANLTSGKVSYLHSELGESRGFYPTIVGEMQDSAIMLDEYSDRIYLFGQDGNATASCSIGNDVLATQYGSPVDILAAGNDFKDGFWLLTERGFVLRVNEDGKLVSKFELRRAFNMHEAYFARVGKHGQSLFAFSPNLSSLLEFTTAGKALKTYNLLQAIGGDLPVTDAVLTDNFGVLLTRGRRLFAVANGHSAEIDYSGIDDDAPLFLDALGSRVLIYNHTGEILVGELK